MIPIRELEKNELSKKNGTYGGRSGSKDGILINGKEWLVKYPRKLHEEGRVFYSTSPISEFVGSNVFRILGYDVQETMLGIRHGKLIVACKDFATNGTLLLEYRTLKNHVAMGYKESSTTGKNGISLNSIMQQLDNNPILNNIPNIKSHFFEQSLVDIFINNPKRDNENWGILREELVDKVAPIYDNGSSFLADLSDKSIEKIMKNTEHNEFAGSIITAYEENGHVLSAHEFIDRCSVYPDFCKAMDHVKQSIKIHMDEINGFIDEIPETYIMDDGEALGVCSKTRKDFYKYQLKIGYEDVLLLFG